MHVRLRMYKYCYSNLGAIYAKGLFSVYFLEIVIIIFKDNFLIEI